MAPLETSSQDRFLGAFAACGSIARAARWAKVSREMHNMWLWTDPMYKKRLKEVQKQIAEDEAVRRAYEGVRVPVWYKGKIVAYKIKYSDSLLISLLQAYNPEKFGNRREKDPWDGYRNKLTQ